MQVGSACRDITPPLGAELSGYLYRVQPSVGVHDPLHVRALYIESAGARLLWLHADLIGLRRDVVVGFRAWAAQRFGLECRQIVLSATHTHAGPATVPLILCGEYDEPYVCRLRDDLERVAEAAMARPEPVSFLAAEGRCDLAIDRRKAASAHTDPRVGVLGWQRPDGGLAAVFANYAMHPVALSYHNRYVSADVTGAAARKLGEALPGRPAVLFTTGAAGNTNPPASTTDFQQVDAWGGVLAEAVETALARATSPVSDATLDSATVEFNIPLEALDPDRIHAIACDVSAAVSDDGSYEHRRYHRGVDIWRRRMLDQWNSRTLPSTAGVKLQLVRLGDVDLLCINAEIFSRFADDLRAATGRRIYVIGYANGVIGYLPPAEAYDEGGYETDSAFIFYGGIRPARGAYEHVLRRAVELIEPGNAVASPPQARDEAPT